MEKDDAEEAGDVCLGHWPHCIYTISPGGQRFLLSPPQLFGHYAHFPQYLEDRHLHYVQGLE